jgi:hypothetical protein
MKVIEISDHLLVFLGLFNNLLAPLLAELFVSSDCFLYIVSQAPVLIFDYKIYFCEVEESSVGNFLICNVPYLMTHSAGDTARLSVTPPFHYSYQCSFSLISSYVYVFIFRYVLSGLVEPVLRLVVYYGVLRSHSQTSGTFWRLAMQLLPPYWRALINMELFIDDTVQLKQHLQVFQDYMQNGMFRTRIISFLVTDLSVLICFGLLFPPLALIVALSILKDIISIKMTLQKYDTIMSNVSDETMREQMKVLRVSIHDEMTTARVSIWDGVWQGIILSTWIWAFVLFDTLASSVGVMEGLWILVVMVACPFMLHYGVYVLSLCKRNQRCDDEDASHLVNSLPVEESALNPMICSDTQDGIEMRVSEVVL